MWCTVDVDVILDDEDKTEDTVEVEINLSKYKEFEDEKIEYIDKRQKSNIKM